MCRAMTASLHRYVAFYGDANCSTGDNMPQRIFVLSTEQISKEAALYTIGFLRVSLKGTVEEAECAGSGTLVTVGSLHGILTAAHVLHALPTNGEIGLVVGIEDPKKYQRQTIKMEHTDNVMMRGKAFDQVGPDLGFLRLPQESVGWLKAQRSFYNLLKPRNNVLSENTFTKPGVDVLIGMIHELTKDVPSDKQFIRRQQFTAIFCGAKLTALRYLDEYELFYYELSKDIDFTLPESFEGTSGGAVWRFYVEDKDGKTSVVDRRLIGIPYFQKTTNDEKREITCHGPKGIYGPFIDKIIQKWPEEASKVS
jgi:hypothetical protein